MYKFELPIGDWSDDGHGKNKIYLIESNKPVEEIRELYFQACNKLGFTLDGHGDKVPCSEYKDCEFKKETFQELIDFGIVISEDLKEGLLEDDSLDSLEFCEIVLALIKTQDPELILNIIQDKLSMFQFYGCDKQNRYIGYFGYGLFS
jgi:hypothetical protein